MITAIYRYNFLDQYASLVHIRLDGQHIGTAWGRVKLSKRNGNLVVWLFDPSEMYQQAEFVVDRFISYRKHLKEVGHEAIDKAKS